MSDEDIKSLVDQLKESSKLAKKIDKPEFVLNKEDLEQFILNNTGKLINDSMETIDSIKEYIISAPEPEDVHSLAELYKASTGAIEALNKVLLQQQKSNTQIAVKTMDIQSKQALAENKDKDKITFTRDEIFDQLIKRGEVIEVDNEDD
jgi:FKBP-type peptidyl-prolyl cis-trans isomerase